MSKPIRYRDDPSQAPEDVLALLAYVDEPPAFTPTMKAWSAKKLQDRVHSERQRRWTRRIGVGLTLAAAAVLGVVVLASNAESTAGVPQLRPVSEVEIRPKDHQSVDPPAALRTTPTATVGASAAPRDERILPNVKMRPAGVASASSSAVVTAPLPAATGTTSASAPTPTNSAPTPSASVPTPTPTATPTATATATASPPKPNGVVLVDPHASPTPPPVPAKRPPLTPTTGSGAVIVDPNASPTPPSGPR